MKYGVTFPQNDIGHDPIAVRDWAQTVEGEGFDYMIAFDHITGAHPDRFVDRPATFPPNPYTYKDEFYEPFVLYSWLAGQTTTLEFTTSILILPQRQTALVAKQSATLDLLSGGRLRLGVGVGWNYTEYEVQNEDFHNRGRRQEEQIEVMRRLWSEELVSFEGRWHKLDREGIAPRPERPIPVWVGGGTNDAILRRVARVGDGWMPNLPPTDESAAVVQKVFDYVAETGRDVTKFGLQLSVNAGVGGPADWLDTASKFKGWGATHLGVGGPARGVRPADHLKTAIEGRKVLLEAGI
jgi:probable F420-dependent oxidoreductase